MKKGETLGKDQRSLGKIRGKQVPPDDHQPPHLRKGRKQGVVQTAGRDAKMRSCASRGEDVGGRCRKERKLT